MDTHYAVFNIHNNKLHHLYDNINSYYHNIDDAIKFMLDFIKNYVTICSDAKVDANQIGNYHIRIYTVKIIKCTRPKKSILIPLNRAFPLSVKPNIEFDIYIKLCDIPGMNIAQLCHYIYYVPYQEVIEKISLKSQFYNTKPDLLTTKSNINSSPEFDPSIPKFDLSISKSNSLIPEKINNVYEKYFKSIIDNIDLNIPYNMNISPVTCIKSNDIIDDTGNIIVDLYMLLKNIYKHYQNYRYYIRYQISYNIDDMDIYIFEQSYINNLIIEFQTILEKHNLLEIHYNDPKYYLKMDHKRYLFHIYTSEHHDMPENVNKLLADHFINDNDNMNYIYVD
ncbi:hypothetical protein QKC54_gp0850 [Megavirus baoshan]|uniref:Uncharacterized protein n=1 Tax=Megavirus baoshan TaxID=2496520 RepID=A0A3Q8U8X7_9VIRU|nr:hypothetical protein QKC54_gp0850 [Megavirus baoshan]AZL90008.1 hypothetical protein Mb0222 [Megavirus baoshan]